ncbi:signal transducer and activator of transcription 6 [Pelodytes ibericus]
MAKVTLWSYVSKMPSEQFEKIYHGFPHSVRRLLADWLENQPWEFITGTDPFCTEFATSLLQKLVEELNRVTRTCGTDGQWDVWIVENFQTMAQQKPMEIVEVFKNILECERTVVLKQNPRLRGTFSQKQKEMQFNFQILVLQHKLKTATILQQQLKHTKENLGFLHDTTHLQMQLCMLMNETFSVLVAVQNQTIQRLNIWKRQQQLAGNGAPFDENLLPLQERLEILLNIYFEFDRLVKELVGIGEQVPPELLKRMNDSLGILVKSSLLVDKQPPQVLKTQTKFQSTVNFLLGHRLLSGVAKLPIVKATIITERRAQELFQTPPGEPWNDGAGDIDNGKAALEITPTTRTCGAVFKNMLLKKIKRCERKGSESVTEEKCAILFVAEINLNSSTFHIQALSLPIVVIVHGNQDNNAKATILWDNAFSEMERRPFFVDERVPWSKMCQTLNLKFVSEVGTKQELLKEHFVFLAQKIFNENSLNEEDFKERTVSWAQFNKEPLRERNFTFWQWFDGVVDLTKKFLKNYWSDRLILGFISKQYVHQILSSEADGTFLLRFSDSEIGGITIAYIVRGEDGFGQIQNIQPFTAKDFMILSLGDRVRDLKVLKTLYKDKAKDVAFEKYYTKKTPGNSGYVPTKITVQVDGSSSDIQRNPASVASYGMDDSCDGSHRTPHSNLHSPNYPPSPMYLSESGLINNMDHHAETYGAFTTSPPHVYSMPDPSYNTNMRLLYSPQPLSYPMHLSHIPQDSVLPNCEPIPTNLTEANMDDIDDILNWDPNWDGFTPHASSL